MIFSAKLSLARQYFWKHIRKFIFLIAALSIGFAVITIMTSLSSGMERNLYANAVNHYGGELFVTGFNGSRGKKIHMDSVPRIKEIIEQWGSGKYKTVPRINIHHDATIFFNGESSRQKNVFGIEWSGEKFNLDRLNIVSGSLGDVEAEGSIVISSLTADHLKCRAGDEVILRVSTLTGQINTGRFVVKAVFGDSGTLGAYKSFVSLDALRTLLDYGENDLSSIGLTSEKGFSQGEIKRLHSMVNDEFQTAPLIKNKEDLAYNLERKGWNGVRYFVIPVNVYISQLDELLQAMDIAAYFIYGMIALIVLASILVTYRIVIRERTREIGTMRAMGMQRKDIVDMLLIESMLLFLLSIMVGFILAGTVLAVISFIPFDSIPGFDLFMKRGKLLPHFSFFSIFVNIIMVMLITLPAVFIPASRAAGADLTKSLEGRE